LITRIINLFLYEDVILKEALRKKKLMDEAVFKDNPEILTPYKSKLKKGFSKLKTIILLVGKKFRKQNGKIIS